MMTRRNVGLVALLVAFALPLAVVAAETASVTGEVIDTACYVKMGAKGDSHRECAQKCADAGIPLAILEDGTGKVVLLVAQKDMETPNQQLREHAGRKVTVTGRWFEKGGVKLLEVASVKPAGK
jgi:hypothetical protein